MLRNYLDKTQVVDFEIKPEGWFTLLGPARKRAEVVAGAAVRETFDFRAVASIHDGKQRINATGTEASNAIEKPITVHPDGEEIVKTASQIMGDTAALEISFPAETIRGSTRAELKFYPNLMAHVIESIEGAMERPHGCGEQTISSTYPSLLVLRYYGHNGKDGPVTAKAQRYTQEGYERLLNYRVESGGFSYWGRGDEADLALTAYALRFLTDAREFIAVDEDLIKEAHAWLVKQQKADGSWSPNNRWQSAGEDRNAARATEKLRALAHDEGGASYWGLETDTPFYGWGLAGRVEATALAGQALARDATIREQAQHEAREGSPAGDIAGAQAAQQTDDTLINRGLLFLLRQKDRYGVWYSTQATINVLDALLTLLPRYNPAAHRVNGETLARSSSAIQTASAPVEIIINGQRATSVAMPRGDQLTGPITVDIAQYLTGPGSNRIELRRPAGSQPSTVPSISSYYVPWSTSTAQENSPAKSAAASGT